MLELYVIRLILELYVIRFMFERYIFDFIAVDRSFILILFLGAVDKNN